MTKRDFYILGLRLCAVYAWFQALTYWASGTIAVMLQTSMSMEKLTVSSFLIYTSPSVLFIAGGAALFRWSAALADWISRSGERESGEALQSSAAIAPLAFSFAGLIGVLMALPQAFQIVVQWFQLLQLDSPPTAMLSNRFSADLGVILGVFAQLAFGFSLLVWSQGYARWWSQKQRSRESTAA